MYMGIPSIEEAREICGIREVKVLTLEELREQLKEVNNNEYLSISED